MSETTVAVCGLVVFAVLLLGFWVRYLVRRVDDAERRCNELVVYCLLERERCEKAVRECRDIETECMTHTAAAFDAAAEVEEIAEGIEPPDDYEADDDEYDSRRRF